MSTGKSMQKGFAVPGTTSMCADWQILTGAIGLTESLDDFRYEAKHIFRV